MVKYKQINNIFVTIEGPLSYLSGLYILNFDRINNLKYKHDKDVYIKNTSNGMIYYSHFGCCWMISECTIQCTDECDCKSIYDVSKGPCLTMGIWKNVEMEGKNDMHAYNHHVKLENIDNECINKPAKSS